MKNLIKYIGVAFVIYIGIFMIWLMLGVGCIEYNLNHNYRYDTCTQDSLSKMIRVTHKPILSFMKYTLEQ